jgi:hypothetical protein
MDRAERIRELKYQGLSEEDAIRRAHEQGESVIDYTRKVPGKGRMFVVVTKDMSGLGFAKQLHDEGETVVLVTENDEEEADGQKQYDLIGTNWLERMPLTKAKTALKSPSTYWIFAENNFPKVADTLRKAGQKVFGTSAFSDKMEHDREFAIEQAKSGGLRSPETYECHSREEGLAYLEDHAETAYVLKPDEGSNAETFVPELEDDLAANEETYSYLEHLKKEPGSYILQERVRGTEVNVEVWMSEGKPFFAFATLEAKRKQEGDYGEMAGCAGDVAWVVPPDCELVKQTVGKMFPLYQKQAYTGFADVNVILTDDGPCFLETCCRFGYNAHPTLFLGLATGTLGDVLADWIDGKVEDIPKRFGTDFAASVCLFLDHPQEGLPVNVAYWEQFHPFDGYFEDEKFLLAGYSPEVGIFVDHGPTPEAAFDAAYAKLCDGEAMSFPNRYMRLDLADGGYPNAIVDRFQQLTKMGMTGRENQRGDHPASTAPLQHGRGLLDGPKRDTPDSHLRAGSRPRTPDSDSRAGRMVSVPEKGRSAGGY